MDKIHCMYQNDTLVTIQTDGVKDTLYTAHDDKGLHVTPGQMLAAALGACTLTMMGAVAAKNNHNIGGAKVSVEPEFAADMSGLKKVTLHIHLPAGLPEDIRRRCLKAAELCPVHRSLRSDIEFIVHED